MGRGLGRPRVPLKAAPPIAYDLTHLEHRSRYRAPTGIERVDLAFGEHFASSTARDVLALHYGFRRPAVLNQEDLRSLVKHVRGKWGLDLPHNKDVAYCRLRSWLSGDDTRMDIGGKQSEDDEVWPNVVSAVRRRTLPYLRPGPSSVPLGSIYVNVAQHALESDVYFKWLKRRRDLHRVFFVHDLLPIDYPEYWPQGHEVRFKRRLDCIIEHATAIITSSNQVKSRIEREYVRRLKNPVPILALPFAPSHAAPAISSSASRSARQPYFVIIGTLEPRKNHLFILNVWRQLAGVMKVPPKLVIAGKRAWNSEAAVSMIERSVELGSCVREIYGLTDDALRELLSNARALLMPSLAEGFGLPLIEALSLRVPVVATDIPVFREVTKESGIFLDPLDGPAWIRTIRALSCDGRDFEAALRTASAFRTFTRADYFDVVEDFLTSFGLDCCH